MPAGDDMAMARIHAAVQGRRWDEARTLLDQALAAQPDELTLLDFAGFVCFFQGDYVATERHCRRALELAVDHAYAWKGLGLALARQGRLDEGTEALERAIALQPRWFDPYWDLAIVQREGGRPESALQTLRRGASSVPERSGDYERLAGLILRQSST